MHTGYAFTTREARGAYFPRPEAAACRVAVTEVTVEPRIVELDAFEVTGIAVATSNQRETSGEPLIAGLWRQVTQGGG